jgi:lysophospholipase L1-like esterase
VKRRQICLFIIATITALGALCYLYPEEGIKVGTLSFEFSSLKDILNHDVLEDNPTITPEDVLQRQRQAALSKERDSLEHFLRTSPTRFHFPDDDLTFFDHFFEALEQADSTALRIIHYGDSQIETDRITGTLRDTLQKYFGGGGQGLVPTRTYYTSCTNCIASTELERYMTFARRADGNKYGPFGDFARLHGSINLALSQPDRKSVEKRTFNKVTVLAGSTKGQGLTISCGKKKYQFPAEKDLVRAVFYIPDNKARANVSISGEADLYGVLMDSKTGIAVDNVPMRGSSGLSFTSMNAKQLKTFYEAENVRMILMQFGGNIVPAVKTERQISYFCRKLRKQIEFVLRLAPDATIVFIGPSDMSTSVNGQRQTYPMLPQIIDSLKHTANSAGVAYWDIYSAMGGKNSMLQWAGSDPALAGSDHVHFTNKGAQLIGEIMANSFMTHYDYYIWRKENNDIADGKDILF